MHKVEGSMIISSTLLAGTTDCTLTVTNEAHTLFNSKLLSHGFDFQKRCGEDI
ncbi:hypothetical protein OKW21_001750 [Catalinimonas alkaloidigena]|uniref:hypothetical protein n=1 Tax=Catalinimonas alkaloidigena TaxID=1075417 RepID=UPI002405C1DB|nr:hypothetical protein [Catalinimonas alkaloidigena]MDF9796487.1 hypothetical protein [Catalinimonas alkaloidigena]